MKAFVETVRQATVRFTARRSSDAVSIEVDGDADIVDSIGFHPDGAVMITLRSTARLDQEEVASS